MSKKGKVLLITGILGLITFAVSQFVSQIWSPALLIPLLIGVIGIIGAIIVDFRFYKDVFAMKTTKSGLNMGTMVLLFFALVAAINYIALKNNKKFDLTSEKLFSLTEQTVQLLSGLDAPLVFKGFYIKGKPKHEEARMTLKEQVRLYQQASPQVKIEIIDPLKEPGLAKEYEINEGGGLIVEYKGRKTRPDRMQEEDFTNAIVKVTREKNKILYFLTNHDEVDLDSEEERGGKLLKNELEGASYDVRTLSLLETQMLVPKDAAAVFVLGPKKPLLDAELKALEGYLKRGGNLLVAVDPGTTKGLEPLYKTLGIKYKNTFVIDQTSQLFGEMPLTALGIQYSSTSEITKKFPSAMSLFFISSGLEQVTDAAGGFKYDKIVSTSPSAISTKELAKSVTVDEKGPFHLVMSVEGKLGGNEKGPSFTALVFGDSDIFTRGRLFQQLNRDLVLNSVAYLAKEEDLITIRPKSPEKTHLAGFTPTKFNLFNMVPFFGMPLLLLVLGGVIYLRRRSS